MKVTRKEEPELFNEIGEMIIDKSQNEHRRGSTFYVKAIVEFKSEHKQHYPNVQDFYKYVGYWETNQYVRSEDDVDWEEDSGGNASGAGIFNCTNEECGKWHGVIYPTDEGGDMINYTVKPNYRED